MKRMIKVNSPIGNLYLAEENGQLTDLSFSELNFPYQETEILLETKKQLDEYFKGSRTEFSLPLDPKGTPWQQKVWQALQEIPYGTLNYYQEIAKKVGNIKASRAVGLANNRNPIAIIIPCHRVVGKNGKMVGYAGGLNIKEYLINLENKDKLNW